MTDSLSKRNKSNKRKGAQYETDLIAYFREQGFESDRLRLSGKQDEGDIAVRLGDGITLVGEAKNTAKHDLARFVGESETEASNYANHRDREVSTAIPVVLMKRRNNPINKSYVVMSLDTLLRIINI